MPLTILIIDDSEADQFLMKYTIDQYDPAITLYKAYDGREALELVESQVTQIDFAFLDINMPIMDGLEFLTAYEKLPEKRVAEIVMLTSSIREEDFERCMAFPFVKRCVSKPLDAASLEEILSNTRS